MSSSIPSSPRAKSVSVAISVHAPYGQLAEHEHTNAYLSLVIEGEYVETLGRASVGCSSYRVRFHPAGEVHADAFGPRGARCLNLELDDQWNPEIAHLGLADPFDALVVETCTWTALRAWKEWVRPSEFSPLVLEEIVATMLGQCTRARREAHALRLNINVRRAVAFVHDSSSAHITLRDVAAAAGLHPTHLARVFRARMGCTVGEYTRRIRAVRALDAMRRHRRCQLSRIAAETGFADHAHLTRVFTRTFGACPSSVKRLGTRLASDSTMP
jgi:AraC family transcriptional regulator